MVNVTHARCLNADVVHIFEFYTVCKAKAVFMSEVYAAELYHYYEAEEEPTTVYDYKEYQIKLDSRRH